jgi:hypothetical protein
MPEIKALHFIENMIPFKEIMTLHLGGIHGCYLQSVSSGNT